MRRVAWLIVPLVAVGLLAFAVFAGHGPGTPTAFTLRPGDCFDIPRDSQVGDVATLDCSTPHDAEVFVAGPVTGPSAAPGPSAYPGDSSFGAWVVANCGSTAEGGYLSPGARTDLAVGYFYPGADAWAHGERQVTCYLHTVDGSKLTAPLGAAAPS